MTRRALRCAAAFWAAVMLLGACTGTEDPSPPPSTTGVTAPPSASPVIPRANAWQRIRDTAPPTRQEVAAAAVRGKFYIVGGLNADGNATDAVSIYDPATDVWTAGPRLPIAVHHAMAAERSGTLVVLGGFAGDLGGLATSRVFVLEGDAWREGPSLRRPRGAAAAVTFGTEVVVVGGTSGGGGHVGPVEIFDGTSWREGASIPSLRDHLGAATNGELVFAAGGRRGGGHFAVFEAYDVAADRWSRLPDMPTARSGIGAAFVGGRVVTVGGEGPRMFPEVEAYDVAAFRWRALPDLAVPLHGVGVVAIGTTVYACAGGVKVGLAPSRACQVLALG